MRSLALFVTGLLVLLVGLQGTDAACPHVQYASGAKYFSNVNPAEGSAVTIPAGETWIFDLAESPIYGGVKVSGRLVFAEQDVILHSYHVTVMNGGEFLIGSCECPFEHKAIIELHFPPNTPIDHNPDGLGTKVIGVNPGGRLEFHGKVFGPTWTSLAVPASAGATTITLLDPVQWRVGDQIVIAGTNYVNGWYNSEANWGREESELKTVAGVSSDGLTVTLDSPLKYAHMSEVIQGIEMRAEVGSLTRNIVVQGDLASNTNKIGAHMMFQEGSHIQLKGIEVTRSGQQFQLGRYPIHFHLFGNASGMAVEDCSIHHNYQRCLTFHGVHYLTVQRNVAFKTYGHCFFLEDGIETRNYIAHNLAMIAYKMDNNKLPGIHSDDQPALYWITNPDNDYLHNHAVSSPFHCYWYALPIFPMGPSYTQDIIPRHSPMGRFEHNVAHGCGADALHVDTGPNLQGVPGGSDSITQVQSVNANGNPATFHLETGFGPYNSGKRLEILTSGRMMAVFASFTAYKIQNRAIWARNGPFHFKNIKSAGNRIGITIACHTFCRVTDSIFVGDFVPNVFDDYPIRGYEFYDGPNELSNSRFYGFKPNAVRNAGAISMLRKDAFTISPVNHLYEIQMLDDSNPLLYFDQVHEGDRGAVFLDLDGTFTGRPPQGYNKVAVVNAHPLHITPGCIPVPNSVHGYYCPNHFALFRLQVQMSSYPTAAQVATLQGLWKLTRRDKTSAPLYLCGGTCNDDGEKIDPRATTGFSNIPLYRDYYVHFLGPSSPTKVDVIIGAQSHTAHENGQAPYSEARFGLCFPSDATVRSVTWLWKDNVKQASSYDDMMSRTPSFDWQTQGDGMWYHDKATGYVWVRVIQSRANQMQKFNTSDWDGWVQVYMSSPGTGVGNCATSGTAEIPDTIRVLPPVGTPPAVPPVAPEVPTLPRSPPNQCGPVPDVACVVSSWSSWSTCSGACGTDGSRSRTRSITTPPEGNGAPCPALTETGSCPMPPCPVNCVLSAWSNWGHCIGQCRDGVETPGYQTRSRTVITPASNGGTCDVLDESRTCTISACAVPVDCEVSPWSDWGTCTGVPCEAGSQTRTRDVIVSPQNGGMACGQLSESQACAVPCPVDCVLGSWADWTPCSAVCGEVATATGTQTRSRTILVPASNGGAPCDSNFVETQPCSVACNVDCRLDSWSPWSECTGPCDQPTGTRTRNRPVLVLPSNQGRPCDPTVETETCNEPCTVSALLNPVVDLKVKVKAISELKVRFTVSANVLGYVAVGIPVNPGVMAGADAVLGWTAGGSTTIHDLKIGSDRVLSCPNGVCSDLDLNAVDNIENGVVTEIDGVTTLTFDRLRKTGDVVGDVPMVELGQEQHLIAAAHYSDVLTYHEAGMGYTSVILPAYVPPDTPPPPAPQNCVVGAWSTWTACSAECNGGFEYRNRTAIVPAAFGGSSCPYLEETQPCNTQPCPSDSVDCEVSAWSPYSTCTVTCGGGVSARTRSVITPPEGLGLPCPPLTETSVCNTHECPPGGEHVDCVVSPWSDFSPCSSTCGGGHSTRTRSVVVSQSGDGAPCPLLSESVMCNTHPCSSDPVDCVMSPWSTWGACDCTSSLQVRTRAIITSPANGGQACPSSSETRACVCNSSPDNNKNKDNMMTKDAAGIPVWAWIAIAAAVVVVIVIVVVIVVVVKKSAAAKPTSKWEMY